MSSQMKKLSIKINKLPVYKHTRKLERAAQTFREDFKDLDSTKYAVSMDASKKHY